MRGGTEQGSDVGRGPRWGGGRVAFLAVALAAAAVVAFLATFVQTAEPDTFFHLAIGRDLVRRGGFAAEDPFLYPLAGLPAQAQPSWLGSLAIYASWLIGGAGGPVWLVALIGGAMFALLLWDALDGGRTASAVACACLPLAFALAVYRERASARPEMFANLLLVTTLVALRRQASGRGGLLLFFPALAVLWINLHHSLAAGLAAIALFVLVNGALRIARRAWPGLPVEVSSWRPLARGAVLAGAGLFAAALLNPSGIAPLVGAAEVVSAAIWPAAPPGAGGADPVALVAAAVDELRAPSAGQWLGPFGWLVGLTFASFLLAWRKVNLREVATSAAFVALAAGAQRFMATAAVVLAPIAARHLRSALDAAPGRFARAARGAALAAALAGAAAAGWGAGSLPDVSFGTGLSRRLPVRAAEYLRAIGFRGKLFNTFHFGGYLSFTLDRKVFQDGRGSLLPADAAAALAGPSAYDRFAALDARYRFDALVVHYPQFTDGAFARLASLPPGSDWGADRRVWALVAFDDGGQVYLRRDGAHAAEAARDEFRLATPTNSLALAQWGERAALRAELLRSLREVPDCARCSTMLGFLLVDEGRAAEAEPHLERAMGGLPETRLYALLGLARAAEARGSRRAAEARWRELVRSAPDPTWSRRRLARLLLDDRREEEAWSEIERNLSSARATSEDVVLAWRIATARGDDAAAREMAARLGRPERKSP